MGGGKDKTISNVDPKVDAIQLQRSAYGSPCTIVFGTTRIPGNVVDYVDFTAIAHTETQDAGGKGGGSTTVENTTWTYTVAAVISLCETPITGVGYVWNTKERYDNLSKLNLALYQNTQWGYMLTYHPERALYYRNNAYVAGVLDLGSSTSMPNLTFEVKGLLRYNGTDDCNPKDVLDAILKNNYWGANLDASRINDLTLYSNYCVANGLFISLAMLTQKKVADWITDICRVTNSQPVWSQGKIKMIPYGDEVITGNGVTYTPPNNGNPLYDLDLNDFLTEKDEPPVRLVRDLQSEVFNVQQIEFLNRDNDYNTDIAEYSDLAAIEQGNGKIRPAEVIEGHFFCSRTPATKAARLVLNRLLYNRNKYKFKLGWKYYLLEPMDIVTITEPGLGLDKVRVRVIEIEETDDGRLDFLVEECPPGVHGTTVYPSQDPDRTMTDYNVDPGNANTPVIFEPPLLVSSDLEVWMGFSGGGEYWGGAFIWVSEDDATYKRVGVTYGKSRQGSLSAILPVGDELDIVNPLDIDLSESKGVVDSVSQTDAENLNSLCYVDGELIAYRDSTLLSTYMYSLEYLMRGCYGTTIAQHGIGSKFLRLDDALFKYPFTEDRIGRTVYVKLVSFNIFGGGLQAIADIQPHTYVITGSGLYSPTPDITGLNSRFENGVAILYWDIAVDPYRVLEYEIRKGNDWNDAQILGRTPLNQFTTRGDGTYWVSSCYKNVYSEHPAGITIVGSKVIQNVMVTYDEQAEGWPGTRTPGLEILAGNLMLAGTGNFSDIPLFSSATTIALFGGVTLEGTYTAPNDHICDVGNVSVVGISCSYTLVGASGNPIYEGHYSDYISAKVEINIADENGIWAGWVPFIPGQYRGRKFHLRVTLATTNNEVSAVLSAFSYTVDVPDVIDGDDNVLVPPEGMNVLFNAAFHSVPTFIPTILNAASGDTPVVTNLTMNGCTIQVQNNGNGQQRYINWKAIGW